MPCNTDYMEPNAREHEHAVIMEFHKEINGKPYDHENIPYYIGPTYDHDQLVENLCAWCSSHLNTINTYSLELQLWWKRHQAADKRRAEEDAKLREKQAIAERNTWERLKKKYG